MNIAKISDRKNEYRQFLVAGLLGVFAGNVNALMQDQPDAATIEIESPLKLAYEVGVDQYLIERLNFVRIMDKLTHRKGKALNPKFGETTIVGDTWIKEVKGIGYVSMKSDVSGTYLFLFHTPPTEVDFYSMYSQAILVGRQSSRLDRIFGM